MKHLRAILILPFTVTVIIPFFISSFLDRGLHGLGLLLVAGFVLLGCGLALLGYTIFLFAREGHGTLAPWDPTQRLVTGGPYRFSRNPMISGVLFILIGEALLFNQLYLLCWAALFFTINHIYFIFKEEPDLEKRFGEEYRKYKENVPRWGVKISGLTGEE